MRLLFLSLLISLQGYAEACSMCKITAKGHTLLGNNEDSWALDPQISFEPGNAGKYGAAYIAGNTFFPQGGINEAGLAYDGFTVYPRILKQFPGRKLLTAESVIPFIKGIMQSCATVEEVYAYVAAYDRSYFNNGMFLFADRSGRYLVVEADTMIFGNEPRYILSNFCPSVTKPEEVSIARYRRGTAFLKSHSADSGFNTVLAAMDTMHECRPGMGDGTLYTNIYDLSTGEIRLYFYHDYRHPVVLNLHEELKKGAHTLLMPTLFPENAEYKKLLAYVTPESSKAVVIFLALSACFFVIVSIVMFCIILYRLFKRALKGSGTKLFLIVFAGILTGLFHYILLKYHLIVYGRAPFRLTQEASLLNAAAYIPLILLILFVWLVYLHVKTKEQSLIQHIFKGFYLLVYLCVLLLFGYWSLYNVF